MTRLCCWPTTSRPILAKQVYTLQALFQQSEWGAKSGFCCTEHHGTVLVFIQQLIMEQLLQKAQSTWTHPKSGADINDDSVLLTTCNDNVTSTKNDKAAYTVLYIAIQSLNKRQVSVCWLACCSETNTNKRCLEAMFASGSLLQFCYFDCFKKLQKKYFKKYIAN